MPYLRPLVEERAQAKDYVQCRWGAEATVFPCEQRRTNVFTRIRPLLNAEQSMQTRWPYDCPTQEENSKTYDRYTPHKVKHLLQLWRATRGYDKIRSESASEKARQSALTAKQWALHMR